VEVSPRHNPVLFAVSETSEVGQARRAALTLAIRAGLDETAAGRVAIAATELATNLAKHAKGGYLLARPLRQGDEDGVELLAVDRGPGLGDISKSMRDGYSTSGTSGTGLGAARRQSQAFDIHSLAGRGTTVVARILPESRRAVDLNPRLEHGVVCLPAPHEEAPGDGWLVHHAAGRSLYVVVDGLGHGPLAAQAAQEALRVASENLSEAPGEMLSLMHAALRATRGAAAAVAECDWATRRLRFAGIGNISAALVTQDLNSRSLMSHNGIVGHQLRRVHELDFTWPPGAILVLHSDGLSAQWKPSDYPGLPHRHPALLAAALHRDHVRSRDDATVLVARDPIKPPVPWEGQ
jgi:anti-sigma regulatory factor (Ser/Thr protein kinase)